MLVAFLNYINLLNRRGLYKYIYIENIQILNENIWIFFFSEQYFMAKNTMKKFLKIELLTIQPP